jgi:hypothetical protein
MSLKNEALEWLRARPRPEPWHDERYAVSLEYIFENNLHKNGHVLDAGGESPFTHMLRELLHCQVSVDDIEWDLRDDHSGDDQARYGLIVATEVIEHIHDLPTQEYGARAIFTSSGQVACLRALSNRLSPQGRIFLTTPNAAGLRTVFNVARSAPPRTYDPHVRELTESELLVLASRSQLDIVTSGQWTVWGHHGLKIDQIANARVAVQMLGGCPDRGDILYAVLKNK